MTDIEVKKPKIVGSFRSDLPTRIQISLYNKRCSGPFLFELVNILAQKSVTHIQVQLADTLQVHNIMWRKNIAFGKAIEIASDEGLSWIRRNRKSLSFCEQNFERFTLSRWSYWTSRDRFEERRMYYTNLRETSVEFSDAVDREIQRYFDKVDYSLSQERLACSRQFLIEEIAISDLSQAANPANEVYPGPRLVPEKLLAEDANLPSTPIRNINFLEVYV